MSLSCRSPHSSYSSFAISRVTGELGSVPLYHFLLGELFEERVRVHMARDPLAQLCDVSDRVQNASDFEHKGVLCDKLHTAARPGETHRVRVGVFDQSLKGRRHTRTQTHTYIYTTKDGRLPYLMIRRLWLHFLKCGSGNKKNILESCQRRPVVYCVVIKSAHPSKQANK